MVPYMKSLQNSPVFVVGALPSEGVASQAGVGEDASHRDQRGDERTTGREHVAGRPEYIMGA